jgi:hypothetical protein
VTRGRAFLNKTELDPACHGSAQFYRWDKT